MPNIANVEFTETENRIEILPPDEESQLAQCLYETMENLDPGDGREWSDLSIRDKEFYRLCIDALLDEKGPLLASALRRHSDDHKILRRAKGRE